MSGNVLNRKLHYWGSALIAIPLLVVIASGIILQWKKDWSWVQPVEQRGREAAPHIELTDILNALKTHEHPEVHVSGWQDVRRLDVRPDRGVAKATLLNDYEVQIDTTDGRVMQVAYRRSDWLEALHDGSIVNDTYKMWIVFPSSVILLFLWGSGIWMWVWPFLNRRKVRARKAAKP
ncbi:MAG: PepSY-associated TM helix domain-containing protein [Acidobacteria bacterium]|nr:PepSY-associated TM helix domain-containing protein [Acidobacteriota bacterium]